MKLRSFSVVLLLTLTCGVHAQSAANAPAGVRIKPASSEDIAGAKASLQAALTTGTLPSEWLNSPTAFGPSLWKALKPFATDPELAGMTKVTVFIDAKPPIQAEGSAANKPIHHVILWKLLLTHYPALKNATIRPATANEIRYFWGTIPIDIEEPLFALDTGTDVFIVNTPKVDGKISLFMLDRVAPYEELRPKPGP